MLLLLYTYEIFCCITGTVGHVGHGKSTLVKAISGVQVGSYSDVSDIFPVFHKSA